MFALNTQSGNFVQTGQLIGNINMKTIQKSNQSSKKNKPKGVSSGLNNLILMQGNSRGERNKMSQTQTSSAVMNDSFLQGNFKVVPNKQVVPSLNDLINGNQSHLAVGMMINDKRAQTQLVKQSMLQYN